MSNIHDDVFLCDFELLTFYPRKLHHRFDRVLNTPLDYLICHLFALQVFNIFLLYILLVPTKEQLLEKNLV